jgi:thiamine transporter
MQNQKNVKILVECAVMVALSAVLSLVKIPWPFGGSVTMFSMVPIIIIGLRHGPVWGFATAFVYSLIQFMFDISHLAGWGAASPKAMIICALFDYIIAFTVLGAAGFFKSPIDKTPLRSKKIIFASIAVVLVCILRYISHVIVGAVIWYEIARGGEGEYYVELAHKVGAWIYSIIYNLQYMLPETIITLVAVPAVVTILSVISDKNKNDKNNKNTVKN